MARERYRRDTAGVGPDPQMAGRLVRMAKINDYKIADGEPDIRGWEVRTLAGAHIGEVDDLLVDPHRGEVVMLDIDLKDSDQHVNLPIRGVQLDRSRNCVVVDSGDIRTARETVMGDQEIGEADDLRVDDSRIEDARAADDTTARAIRYGRTRDTETDRDTTEEVIERRPVIEEVVVRRRPADDEEEA